MPNLPDAAVVLAGSVIDVKDITERGTGVFQGRTVTVMDDDGGFAKVKVRPDDRVTIPHRGDEIVWVVQNRPWAIEGNSGMATAFVRAFSNADGQRLTRILGAGSAAPKAA